MTRISTNYYFMLMAHLVSLRATCARRRVGCVLVSERNHVLATGYNGPPAKFPHCTEFKCPGADLPSGQGLDSCHAIHAEQNAILQCDSSRIRKVYCTTLPCPSCLKMLLNTPMEEIHFADLYPKGICLEQTPQYDLIKRSRSLTVTRYYGGINDELAATIQAGVYVATFKATVATSEQLYPHGAGPGDQGSLPLDEGSGNSKG